MDEYKFDCGCSFPIVNEKNKSDGLPSLYIPYDDIIEDLNYGKSCPETWKVFQSGHTKGIFQLENNLGAEWSAQISPFSLEELSAVISVIRPGTLKSKNEKGKSLTKIFADRKKGIEPTKAYVPALEDILKETYQIIVYQESAIRIAQEVAGFSEEDADKLRKAMGKKDADLMAKIKNWFLKGCKETKIITDEQAEVIFSWIQESQRYSFNKCLNPTTLVELPDGTFKQLNEINIGDYVKAPSKDGDCFVEVLDIIDNGEQEVYEITLESGKTIECTINHKFLCEDSSIRPLYEIIDNNLKIVCESD